MRTPKIWDKVSPGNLARVSNLWVVHTLDFFSVPSIFVGSVYRMETMQANFSATLRSHLNVTCSCYFCSCLFIVDVNYTYTYLDNYSCSLNFIGFVYRWRLCINFSFSRVNFLMTLRSHLNYSCYCWSSLFNGNVNYSYLFC